MIPYIHVAVVSFGPFSLDVEALLTAVGLIVGVVLAHGRAQRLGIERTRLDSFLLWLLIGAVVGGHVCDVLCYRFHEIVEISWGQLRWKDPWELLRLWHGWRSVGGFLGAIAAALMWRGYVFRSSYWFGVRGVLEVEGYRFVRREHRERILGLADVVLSVFPVAWVFNRVGTMLTHDRPGMRAPSEALLAVAYPEATSTTFQGFGVVYGNAPRYDLGLLELLVILPLLLVTLVVWKKSRRPGVFVGLAGLTYPPARFGLDFFGRTTGAAADPRLGSLTPAQWGFVVIWGLAVFAVFRIRTARSDAIGAA